MKIFRRLEELPRLPFKTALAIGNFDGLHLGHQKILKTLAKNADLGGQMPWTLTFSPHPEKFFGPDKICMIQTIEQRLEGLEKLGVRVALVMPFNRAFAQLSGRDFVHKILVDALHVRTVIVGQNFRFGEGRQGNISALHRFGKEFGFQVRAVRQVKRKGRTVSSSLIREFLKNGRVEAAKMMLGRPYEIEGTVIAGDARGQSLGFPTANIATPNEIIPRGVFITWANVNGRFFPSLTNVGVRPTFGRRKFTIETHILDFGRKIYGTRIRLRFLKKIRNERSFSDPEKLRAQICRDIEFARESFKGIRS